MTSAWSVLCAVVVARLWLVMMQFDGQVSLLGRLLTHDIAAIVLLASWQWVDHSRGRGWKRARWCVAALLVVTTAATTPLLCRLGTPLTYSMLQAADGALSDSVGAYLDALSLSMVATVMIAACLPLIATQMRAATVRSGVPESASSELSTLESRSPATAPAPRRAKGSLALLLLLAAIVLSTPLWQEVPLRGLQRNTITALAETTWERWRTPRASSTQAWGTAQGSRRGGGRKSEARAQVAAVVAGHQEERPPVEALSQRRLQGGLAGYNVVWVVLESVGAQYLAEPTSPVAAVAPGEVLGVIGDATIAEEKERDSEALPMPFLAQLASEGWWFDNAYATYPESIKGLVALLDSRYPAIHTAAENYRNEQGSSGAVAALQSLGYSTALFHSGRFGYLGMDAVIGGRGFDTLADAGAIGGERDSSFGVDEESTVAAMLDWTAQQDQPYALCYMPIAGHHPYDSPLDGPYYAPRDGESDFVSYLNAIHYCDHALQLLYDGLAAQGELERTVWVVVGDHGQAFEQHPGNTGHVFQIYDENVRIPLLLWAPQVLPPWHSSRVVSALDVAPTLLDLLSIDGSERLDGESLLDAGSDVALFFSDYSRPLLGLRCGSMKFIVGGDGTELYNLEVDSAERVNISAQHPQLCDALTGLLHAWRDAERYRRLRPQG